MVTFKKKINFFFFSLYKKQVYLTLYSSINFFFFKNHIITKDGFRKQYIYIYFFFSFLIKKKNKKYLK